MKIWYLKRPISKQCLAASLQIAINQLNCSCGPTGTEHPFYLGELAALGAF